MPPHYAATDGTEELTAQVGSSINLFPPKLARMAKCYLDH